MLERALLLALMLLCTALPLAAKEAPPVAADPALEARMMDIAGELRCLVCQNQTIADSHADLAVDLRQEIREMLARGMTDAQIRRYMTDRYGAFVLYKPPLTASTALLWFGPALLGVIALVMLYVALRRRLRMSADAFDPETPDEEDTLAAPR